ncbi:MAG: glycohydrolase toxin TNT-related protein [Clostridia bacterium]|nr:glycohydrolase toxin TNT-related protein [Clostridia bacterium]
MDNRIDTSGSDASSNSGKDAGIAVSVSSENVEVPISTGNMEISTSKEGDGNIGDAKTGVVIDRPPVSVNISGSRENIECEITAPNLNGMNGIIENMNISINAIKERGEGTEADRERMISDQVNSTMTKIGMSSMKPEDKVEAMRTAYNSIPEGMRKNLEVPENVQNLDENEPFDAFGKPVYKWPGNMGFDGTPNKCQLEPGQVVDRYGNENGTYVCEVKNGVVQDYEPRGLPYAKNPEMYHQYAITRDLDEFGEQIKNLTVEQVEEMEMRLEAGKPESERRSPEQIKEDAANRYVYIINDVEKNMLQRQNVARENGWENECSQHEFLPMQGKVKEAFSRVDENGKVHKLGGGEQIQLPASVDTLTFLGYMKEV